MVNVYEVIRNDNNMPELLIIKQINYEAKGGRYDAAFLLKKEFHLDILNVEHNYLIGFSDNWIMSVFLISIGTNDTCELYYKQIATNLLLSGSESFCLFHNHPNQIINPSDEDINVANDMQKIADLLELDFLGSYIVTKHGFMSTNDSIITQWEV